MPFVMGLWGVISSFQIMLSDAQKKLLQTWPRLWSIWMCPSGSSSPSSTWVPLIKKMHNLQDKCQLNIFLDLTGHSACGSGKVISSIKVMLSDAQRELLQTWSRLWSEVTGWGNLVKAFDRHCISKGIHYIQPAAGFHNTLRWSRSRHVCPRWGPALITEVKLPIPPSHNFNPRLSTCISRCGCGIPVSWRFPWVRFYSDLVSGAFFARPVSQADCGNADIHSLPD